MLAAVVFILTVNLPYLFADEHKVFCVCAAVKVVIRRFLATVGKGDTARQSFHKLIGVGSVQRTAGVDVAAYRDFVFSVLDQRGIPGFQFSRGYLFAVVVKDFLYFGIFFFDFRDRCVFLDPGDHLAGKTQL